MLENYKEGLENASCQRICHTEELRDSRRTSSMGLAKVLWDKSDVCLGDN